MENKRFEEIDALVTKMIERDKLIKHNMTPQEELEVLDDLYVANDPLLTHINIANRIGELLNIVSPIIKPEDNQDPCIFYERD